MKHVKVDVDLPGMRAEGTVVLGDWTGDGSIPNGSNMLAPYVDELWVIGRDDEEIGEMLSKSALADIENRLIMAAREVA